MTEYDVVQLDQRGNELLAGDVLLYGLPGPRIGRARRSAGRQPEQTQPLLNARWCHAPGTLPGLMPDGRHRAARSLERVQDDSIPPVETIVGRQKKGAVVPGY